MCENPPLHTSSSDYNFSQCTIFMQNCIRVKVHLKFISPIPLHTRHYTLGACLHKKCNYILAFYFVTQRDGNIQPYIYWTRGKYSTHSINKFLCFIFIFYTSLLISFFLVLFSVASFLFLFFSIQTME